MEEIRECSKERWNYVGKYVFFGRAVLFKGNVCKGVRVKKNRGRGGRGEKEVLVST